MDATLLQALLSVLRSLLAAGAGYLVAKGYVNSEVANSVVGLLVLLAPMIWGVMQKYKQQRIAEEKARIAAAEAATAPRAVWTPEQRAAQQ